MTARPSVGAGFAGFRPEAFAFLEALAAEQNRAWFLSNKAVYEQSLQAPMAALLVALGPLLAGRGLPFLCDPKRAVFRIHRDVRFSRDKQPYKTHVGAALTRTGEKMSPGVLYIHIDPAGCFVAAGFYHMEPGLLDAMRERIAYHPGAFRAVVAALEGGKLPIAADEEALKRLPRGYEAFAGEDFAGVLRHRSLIVRRTLSRAAVSRASLATVIADFALAAAPLLEFGWRVVEEA